MDFLLYSVALGFVRLLQMLPITMVAVLGRLGGRLAHLLDKRHRTVARNNLSRAFPEKPTAEIRAIARESFRRIGESFACAAKTAAMDWPDLKPRCEFVGTELLLPQPTMTPRSVVVAVGHFGNFELYARLGHVVPAFKCLTTYRALREPGLSRLMQSLRERSGCLFFERRSQANDLKAAMQPTGVILGLFADQHAGNAGLRLPFLGRECSTSAAPAVFALRYHCRLHTGICYRTGLARWRLEAGPEIPTEENGRPRPTEAIMADVNRAFEAAVRRDPANWFWVHNRWKPAPARKPAAVTTPAETELPA
ncbi:MAG: hypothetical protein HY301_08120 [Verrucomicrobia bacterium]|nr:hypothetical protein [Verrucomicrobiota bacterium]